MNTHIKKYIRNTQTPHTCIWESIQYYSSGILTREHSYTRACNPPFIYMLYAISFIAPTIRYQPQYKIWLYICYVYACICSYVWIYAWCVIHTDNGMAYGIDCWEYSVHTLWHTKIIRICIWICLYNKVTWNTCRQ